MTRYMLMVLCGIGFQFATPAEAQTYRDVDGCLYQQRGAVRARIECQWFDSKVGAQALRNARGTFYKFGGRWITDDDAMLMAMRGIANGIPREQAMEKGMVILNPDGTLSIRFQGVQSVTGNRGLDLRYSCNGDTSVLQPTLQNWCQTLNQTQYFDGLRQTQDEYGYIRYYPVSR